MKHIAKAIAALALALVASGCTTGSLSSAAPVVPAASAGQGAQSSGETAPDIRVARIDVSVPRSLTVSEADTIKPRADIVWHGDPAGDRHAQVGAVVEAGLARGVAPFAGARPVVLEVELLRFHAQTHRVRYSRLPSEHEIEFLLTVRDARTGAVLRPARKVDATFRAYGGQAAVEADRQGITQTMRITDRLAQVIRQELGGLSGL
ncbi:DUF6778 family protein [Celeribacter indicus]|uniref:Lipoprotein n=1 Tax=Celeribacter indicus TaxID=1208324 RepID=A0A0B5E5Q1_9RHOB|nr:DUF6778 family protein [Celeribacter indicus]AJE47652.1 hypothetical protein P73_2937 [Celeribacter indicus]SDW13230.1 hypothetical protein SAMN05443573_101497 [Celeribacter indicus]